MGTMEGITGIISVILVFVIPLFALYLSLQNSRLKNQENMELIKQGIIPPQADKSKPTPNKYRSLRNGFLCIGIGLGLVVGMIAQRYYDVGMKDSLPIMGASILLFLGIAYVAFFLVVKDKNFDKNSDNE